jgi:SAM-dependent methyltransferase
MEDLVAPPRCWSHNSAYYRLVRRAVPRGAADLLDVGCGEGRLARELTRPGRRVLGLEPDADSCRRAQDFGRGCAGLEFAEAAFLDSGWGDAPDSFDFISFVASLHHMDEEAALVKARELLRPGGRLVVVGLGRETRKADLFFSALCVPIAKFNDLRPDRAEPDGMVIAEPKLGWSESRALARRVLPGATYHRHVFWRYVVRWTKPER